MTVEPWIKTGHCQTRDGREVRIYATDGGRDRLIHGAVRTREGWEIYTWIEGGKRWRSSERPIADDLIPIERAVKERWRAPLATLDKTFGTTLVETVTLNVTRDHEGRVTKVELAE